MRSLTQPRVLRRAALAALLTTLAACPRLDLWKERPHSLPLYVAVLLYCAFMLWAFVFAWHPQYAQQPVFRFHLPVRLFAFATLCGIVWALALHLFIDPWMRQTTPKDYPADWNSWIAMTLFWLAFQPLFVCFAPFAFFIRLARRQPTALALTVIFGVFVLLCKINASPTLPSPLLVMELMAMQVIAGFFSVYFYVRGGAILVWWVFLLLQFRHLFELAARH